MKNLFKRMWVNKTLAIFVLFFALTFPKAIYEKSEFEKRAIFTSVGIDKVEEGYEFSGLVVVEEDPTKISSNVEVVSSKGGNIAEAIYTLSITLGKEIGLAHCDSIVVGNGLEEENLAEVLDYFIRTSNLTKNTNLISCSGSAKELLEANTNNKDENGITFSKLISTGSDYLAVVEMNIEEFYSRYFNRSSVAWVTIIDMEEESGGESASSGGSSQGEQAGGESSGGQSKSEEKKKLKCDGSFSVYKKGVKAFELRGDEAVAMNLLNPYTKKGYLTITDVEENGIVKEKMGIKIIKKKTDLKYYFSDGVACLDINFKMYAEVVELQSPNPTLESINISKTHIGDNTKKAIKEKLSSNLESVIEKAKEKKVDIFSLCDRLYRFKNGEFKKYIKESEIEEQYISNFKVNLNVEIEPKL